MKTVLAILFLTILPLYVYSGDKTYEYYQQPGTKENYKICHVFDAGKNQTVWLDRVESNFSGDAKLAWQARCICDHTFIPYRENGCSAFDFNLGKSRDGCTCGKKSKSNINTFRFEDYKDKAIFLSSAIEYNPYEDGKKYDKSIVILYPFRANIDIDNDSNKKKVKIETVWIYDHDESLKTTSTLEIQFCGDGETQAHEGEKCDDGQNNGKVGFCNSLCSGYVPKQTTSASAEKQHYIDHETRIALLIGNADYKYGGKLANPVNDVKALESVLKKDLGFQTILHENSDQKEMKKAIDDFGSNLSEYQVRLFFYAGHGFQVNGRNYLIPVDAELKSEKQVEYDCVDASRVLAQMDNTEKRTTNIIILDACRDNPFERSWFRSAKGKGLAFMDAPSGSIIAYATSPGNTASDGKGSNGLYTSAILEHIRTPNITIEQMFKRVRSTTIEHSNNTQVPWESTCLSFDFALSFC